MHPKNINQNFGYLGPYDRIIEVGDDNHMVFQEDGNGPLWMTTKERVYAKFSNYDEPSLKDKTKAE